MVFDDEVPSFTPFSDEFAFLLTLVVEGSFGSFCCINIGTRGTYPPFFYFLLSRRTGPRLVVAIDDDIFRTGDLPRLCSPLGFVATTQ